MQSWFISSPDPSCC